MKFWALLITLSVSLVLSFSLQAKQEILVEGQWITPQTFGFKKVPAHRLFPAPNVGQTIKYKTSVINKKLERVNIPKLSIDSEYIYFKHYDSESITQQYKKQCLELLPTKQNENWQLDRKIELGFLGELQSITTQINKNFAYCEITILTKLQQEIVNTFTFEKYSEVWVWKAKNNISSGTKIIKQAFQSLENINYSYSVNINENSRANGSISKDQIIKSQDILADKLIWKGEKVMLYSVVGEIKLSVIVTALESGNKGDFVSVLFNGNKIEAKVIALNKVEIRGKL